ncbi:MAG: hypothetical protein ABH851_05655 [Methanobacteriota archaeon]
MPLQIHRKPRVTADRLGLYAEKFHHSNPIDPTIQDIVTTLQDEVPCIERTIESCAGLPTREYNHRPIPDEDFGVAYDPGAYFELAYRTGGRNLAQSMAFEKLLTACVFDFNEGDLEFQAKMECIENLGGWPMLERPKRNYHLFFDRPATAEMLDATWNEIRGQLNFYTNAVQKSYQTPKKPVEKRAMPTYLPEELALFSSEHHKSGIDPPIRDIVADLNERTPCVLGTNDSCAGDPSKKSSNYPSKDPDFIMRFCAGSVEFSYKTDGAHLAEAEQMEEALTSKVFEFGDGPDSFRAKIEMPGDLEDITISQYPRRAYHLVFDKPVEAHMLDGMWDVFREKTNPFQRKEAAA